MELLEKSKDTATIRLSEPELLILLGSVRETLECLDWDFHIRMGAEKTEASHLLSQLVSFYDTVFSSKG